MLWSAPSPCDDTPPLQTAGPGSTQSHLSDVTRLSSTGPPGREYDSLTHSCWTNWQTDIRSEAADWSVTLSHENTHLDKWLKKKQKNIWNSFSIHPSSTTALLQHSGAKTAIPAENFRWDFIFFFFVQFNWFPWWRHQSCLIFNQNKWEVDFFLIFFIKRPDFRFQPVS